MADEKELFPPGGFSRLVRNLQTRFLEKFDKIGGEITGDVKIDGNLVLDIEDEDYDAGIRFTKALDDNLGTVLTLTGYANANGNNTNYKTLLRNIATPNSAYDAANKQYVDDMCSVPTLHLVDLNLDGSVKTQASTLKYSTIASNLTNPKRSDYLDCFWENGQGTNSYTRFQAHTVGLSEVNSGDVMFTAELYYLGIPIWIVFTLNTSNVLTTVAIIRRENVANKTDDIVSNSASSEKYPSTKAVYSQFQRKPDIVWQDDTGLKALQVDIAASMNWQLTGLDMTPYKRIKVYAKSGKGSTSAGTTGQMMVEMLLDDRCKVTAYGGHFVGSVLSQKPNDANRYASLTVAVSADKTSFAVLRQTSLYGTAATTNNDIGANVFLIEGYYD
jgi:hypothetical protein